MLAIKDRVFFASLAFATILLFTVLSSKLNGAQSQTSIAPTGGRVRTSYKNSVQDYFEERWHRADTLWRQSVLDRQTMLSHYPDADAVDFPDGFWIPYHIFEFARPTFFCPHDLERIGKLGDGGKWLCGMMRYEEEFPPPSAVPIKKRTQRRNMIMYSFGINDDSSFEYQMLRRTNVEIWGYDMSVNGWAKDITADLLPRAHFTRAGIADVTNTTVSPPFFSIQDLIRRNGHDFIDIMKIDIEGAEWDTFHSFFNFINETDRTLRPSLPIGQLLIELHVTPGTPSNHLPRKIREWISWFEQFEYFGMRPVMNEGNWIGDKLYGHPRFMEYTFINSMQKDRNVLLTV